MNILRSKITRRAFGGLLLGALGSAVYAGGVEPKRLEVTRKTLRTPRLPGGLDGLKVVVLTDIHYDPEWQKEPLTNAVEAANAEKADLIMLPGDFITRDPEVIYSLAPLLGKLKAKHGVFASPGNHDRWHDGSSTIRKALEKQGIPYLINESTRLNVGGQGLHIVGTDSVWAGNLDADRAFGGTRSDSTIALVHEPDPFEVLGARSLLQVSGHTHGGQCRVPLIGYAPVGVSYGRKYVYGEFQQEDGGRLFVSRGLGTVGFRVRFACVPEVAVLTLRAGVA